MGFAHLLRIYHLLVNPGTSAETDLHQSDLSITSVEDPDQENYYQIRIRPLLFDDCKI